MNRVLHIFNALRPSGAETMWCAAAGILARQGVETHMLATDRDVGAYADNLRSAGFVVHHLPCQQKRGFAVRLRQFVRQGEFDAVVVHTEERLFTKALMSRLAGARVVCVHHAIFTWEGKSRLKRCLAVAVLRILGCRFVAVSESVARNERRFGHRPPVIWNWMDEPRFDRPTQPREDVRRALGLGEGDKVLITVGNCTSVKNHAFLFEVLRLLPPEYKLLHVGAENEAAYGERKKSADLGERVRFLGARADIPDLLGAADLFVMSSRCEGLGLACIEALYCGLPAVVGDVAGLRDVARRVPACRLCDLTAEAFAGTIVDIAGRGRPSAEALRASVRPFVSMERSVGGYLKLMGIAAK